MRKIRRKNHLLLTCLFKFFLDIVFCNANEKSVDQNYLHIYVICSAHATSSMESVYFKRHLKTMIECIYYMYCICVCIKSYYVVHIDEYTIRFVDLNANSILMFCTFSAHFLFYTCALFLISVK